MKSLRFLSMMIFVCAFSAGYAQKAKTYKVWVSYMDNHQVRGLLSAADGNGLVVLGEDLIEIPVRAEAIKEIKVRRKGSVGRGAWIGAASGAIIGGLIGYSGGDDEPGWFSMSAGDKAGAGVFVGAPVGTLFGMAFGSGKKTFPVNGNKETYLALLPDLQQYVPPKN